MATYKLLLLPGDGIGPEVMAEVKRLIGWLNAQGIAHFETEEGLVGGAAYDASKQSITDATMAQALAADAVIFGAVGGPKWDSVPYEVRPEAGLLRLRKDLALYANLRPAICYPALAESSNLKPEVVEGLDIMIVRELTGGVDRIHEAGRGIGPAEAVAHVRQHQRVGEAAEAKADAGRKRQDQDQPREVRGRGWPLWCTQLKPPAARILAASGGRAIGAKASCQPRNAVLAIDVTYEHRCHARPCAGHPRLHCLQPRRGWPGRLREDALRALARP
jgi:hypothetical protein